MYNPVEALGRALELHPLTFAHFCTLSVSRANYLPAQVTVHSFPSLMASLAKRGLALYASDSTQSRLPYHYTIWYLLTRDKLSTLHDALESP